MAGKENAMGWFERLKKAAGDAVDRASTEAEKAAQYVAQHGPGFVGDGAAELLAERDYRRAAALAEDELDAPRGRQVQSLLLPHWNGDSNYAVLINQLLGDAYLALGEPGAATEHYQRALDLLRDPMTRRTSEPVIVDESGVVAEELELELLLAVAQLALDDGQYELARHRAMEALSNDPRCLEAHYLQAAALVGLGRPASLVQEALVKALLQSDYETVLPWVEELLPDQVDWFRGRFG